MIRRLLLALVALFALAGNALADWTPLITADDFTGIQTDVMTVAGGLLSIILIIVGIAALARAMNR